MSAIDNPDMAAFNKHSQRFIDDYDAAAFAQRELADRLLDRLQWMSIKPKTIVDLGARTGYTSVKLLDYYKESQVIAVDSCEQMLACHEQASSRHVTQQCDDFLALPFANQSVDLVFFNCLGLWVHDLPAFFSEVKRILIPNGLFLFTSLGPDTLYELRASFEKVDDEVHVYQFEDMHNVGDTLMQAGLEGVVMDSDCLTLKYKSITQFFTDLQHSVAHNADNKRGRGLLSFQKFKQVLQGYEAYKKGDYYPVTLEVIQGQAWSSVQNSSWTNAQGEVMVPIDSIL